MGHFKSEASSKTWNARFAGQFALNNNTQNGYKQGGLDGGKVYAHRVAYKIYYGKEPNIIDHGKLGKSNNSIENLNDGTHQVNSMHMPKRSDCRSGFTGVSLCGKTKKWQVHIHVNGKNRKIGRFANLEDAVQARYEAEVKFGYHPDHGKFVSNQQKEKHD